MQNLTAIYELLVGNKYLFKTVDVMQQMEEAIQQSSAFRETSERLQRENQDLKQKVVID